MICLFVYRSSAMITEVDRQLHATLMGFRVLFGGALCNMKLSFWNKHVEGIRAATDLLTRLAVAYSLSKAKHSLARWIWVFYLCYGLRGIFVSEVATET